MLHFFVDSGIKDTLYFWGEFHKALKLYIELKKESEKLDSFNLGGGFAIRNHLGFEYNYEYMINEIIKNIQIIKIRRSKRRPFVRHCYVNAFHIDVGVIGSGQRRCGD